MSDNKLRNGSNSPSKNELNSALEKLLDKTPDIKVSRNPLDFIAIGMETFPSAINLPCPVYIKVGDKFVMFRNAGEQLTQERVDGLRKASVQALFVQKEAWKIFMEALENLRFSDETPPEERASHLRNVLAAYGKELEINIGQKKPNKEFFGKIRNTCERLAECIFHNKVMGKTLLKENSEMMLYFVNHSINVAVYSTMIGINLALPLDELKLLLFSSLLHDIGRLRLPRKLFFGTEFSSQEEKLEYQNHTNVGAEILQQIMPPPCVVSVALQHHERFDGTGYPKKLVAERIHLYAKICAVGNIFDNLISKRPGWEPMTTSQAVQEIQLMEGMFDPSIVKNITKG